MRRIVWVVGQYLSAVQADFRSCMRIVQVDDRQLAGAVFDVQLGVALFDGKSLVQFGDGGCGHGGLRVR